MRPILVIAIIAISSIGQRVDGLGAQRQSAQPLATVPNIIVVIADDLGWQDTALPMTDRPTALNQRYRTPNLLRLAGEGVKFTDAYAAAPLCTPTRVTELTGRMPAQTRVTHIAWLQDKDYTVLYPPPGPPVLISPDWNLNGLSPHSGIAQTYSAPVLPEILRRAGYRTIHVGKAHWGAPGTPGADPHAMGFDVNIGGSGAGEPGSFFGARNYKSLPRATVKMDVPGLEAYHGTDTFLTEALTIEANKAIDAAVAEKKPFFLHFAHFAVHTPIQADKRFLSNYASSGLSPVEAAYATLIEGLDKSLGDIMANVARHGLTNNTLIIFTSDNGGSAASRNQNVSPFSQNTPLRSVKASAYEGGLRVVQVISWPGRIKGGQTNRTPVVTDDIFPTLLTLARVPDRETLVKDIRGRDLMPMLTGGKRVPSDRPLLWHYPHRDAASGPGQEPFSAVRVGPWKLIFFYLGRRYELYNLEKDLGESQNVLDANTAIATRLSGTLRHLLNGASAQMPLDAATKLPVEPPPAIHSVRR